MIHYIIKIDIDNTFIYKLNNFDNSIIKLYDNVGKFTIPTILYINTKDDDSNDILYGNEISINNIYKHGWISCFLLLLNLKNIDTELHDFFENNNIKVINEKKCQIKIQNKIYTIKDLLILFLKYLINIINDHNNDENINYNIIIPCILNNKLRNDLYEIYEEIFKELNISNVNFINENIKDFDIFISINEYNINFKTNNEYIEKKYGLKYIKDEIFKIIINKMRKNDLNMKLKDKIKQYIHYNFDNIIRVNNFNCILELDEIYNILISKNDLYNCFKYIRKEINKVIQQIKVKDEVKILSYNKYIDLFDLTNVSINYYDFLSFNDFNCRNEVISNLKDIHPELIKIPITLGIDTENGIMCRLINKNTVIPCIKSKIFLYKIKNEKEDEKQDEFKLLIYKGNNLYSKSNELLKEIFLNLKNKFSDKELKLKITFSIYDLNSLHILIENTITNDKYEINNIDMKIIDIDTDNLTDSEDEFQAIEL